MKIKGLFIGGSVVIAVVMVLIIGVFIYFSQMVKQQFSMTVNKDIVVYSSLQELLSHGLQGEQALRNVILNPQDETARKNYEKAADSFVTSLGVAEKATIIKGKLPLDKIRQQWAALSGAREEVLKLGAAGDREGAVAALKQKETPVWRELKDTVNQAIKIKHEGFAGKTTSFSRRLHLITYGFGGFLLVVTVGVLLLFKVANDRIINPLGQMVRLSNGLSQGDGDLTARLAMQRNDEIGEVSHSIDSFIGKVQSSIAEAKESASETAVAGQELSHIAGNLSDTVQKQHQIVEESEALTQEITSNLDLTEEMAITTTETIQETQKVMISFANNLNSAGDVIIGEAGNQQQLAARMQTLASNAGKIREVLEIISDIADQTNLLALNASIEAARAGEMGRGFAVVADEVRQLAAKTQSSLSQINQSVSSVVNGVEELCAESEESSRRMLNISDTTRTLIGTAGESGDRLKGAVDISSELVKRSTFIATRTKQLMELMHEMTSLAAQNSSVSAEVGEVSVALARKSDSLKMNLDRFRC